MQLIDADSAQAGLTIIAGSQTQGKGQRGKTWEDIPTQSLLMTIVVTPERTLEEQFAFNATVAVAISKVLLSIYEHWDVRVKWPNDIIINDKKAGGILIENVIRGDNWDYSIIGLGMNVLQDYFPTYLPYATSMKMASGTAFSIPELLVKIRSEILLNIYTAIPALEIIKKYNEVLYRKDMSQGFTDGTDSWNGVIREVQADGRLLVQLADGSFAAYTHGKTTWKWA